ncbi:MAG: secretion protein HlyD [Burkholderiales bacterium PBB4]|nr:MAG: secretion protein HlyD [Burkholderiales bacterium PBB4]
MSTPKMNPSNSVVEDTSDTGLPADSKSAARVGLWALSLGFGAFVLWAAYAPLDEGVPGPGIVAIDTKRKPIQHLSGGIVKEVLVREGEEVKAGQVLLRMDDAVSKSNFESVRQRYLGLRAMQGRLEAENRGQASIRFHPDLVAASKDALIQQQMITQQQLFETRRMALQADLQSIEESIRGQQSIAQAYEGMLGNRKNQLALLNEELNNTRGLVKEGYVPRNRQLELERMVAEANNALAELQGNIARGLHSVAELRQRMIVRQKEFRKEVDSQLADVTREVQSDEVKFKAVEQDLERTDIKAPVAGQVMGLAFQTPGTVLQPGQKIMDVVPENEALLLEVRVAPHLIDHVKDGLKVDVRFSSFAHSPQLVVAGTVVSISSDLNVEPQTNVSYYLARVRITPEGLKTLGNRQMQPGMPVEVVFKTGERSLLTYLLHPLTKRVAAAMKEE